MAQADFFIRQGDTASSVSATVRDADANAVDIQGATVTFALVPVEGGTAIVDDADANNDQVTDGSDGSLGNVSYDWGAGETDVPGFFLGSWTVTFAGGEIQTFPNSGYILLYISPDQPTELGQNYISVEAFKSAISLTGQSYADDEALAAVTAASRGIDNALGRRFYADEDAAQVRYYTPLRQDSLYVDDIVTLTELATDKNGGTDFGSIWTANTDFVLEPLNAAADGWPYTRIRSHPRSSLYFPTAYPRSVRVTGKFGWAAIPQPIEDGCVIIASRILKRKREAPFGAAAFGAEGAVAYATSIARDSELQLLIGPYSRNSMLA